MISSQADVGRSPGAMLVPALALMGVLTLVASAKHGLSGPDASAMFWSVAAPASLIYLGWRARTGRDEWRTLMLAAALLAVTFGAGFAFGSITAADFALGCAVVATGLVLRLPLLAGAGTGIAAAALALGAAGAPGEWTAFSTGAWLVAAAVALLRTRATAAPAPPADGTGAGELAREDDREAAGLCANAFLDDPAMVKLVPSSARLRAAVLRGWFAGLLRIVRRFAGRAPAAVVRDGELVAVAMAYEPGRYPAPSWVPLLAPAPLMGGPRCVWRALQWARVREHGHPEEPHLYLETLAVAPAAQRTGAGRKLLMPLCDEADRRNLPIILHTNLEANLAYYERFGFEVIRATELPQGAPEWLLRRPPAAIAPGEPA